MELSKDELKSLNTKRINLRGKIKEHVALGKDDVKDLTNEYNDLLKYMKSVGYKVSYMMELDYTNKRDDTVFNPVVKETKSQPKKQQDTHKEPEKETLHILNIAWTENKGTDDKTISVLDDYLKTIADSDIYNDSSDDGFEIEHIIKYKYKTTEKAFNVIKASTQYIKDMIKDDEKDDIEIFGRCIEK